MIAQATLPGSVGREFKFDRPRLAYLDDALQIVSPVRLKALAFRFH